jgi:hypothetical protein
MTGRVDVLLDLLEEGVTPACAPLIKELTAICTRAVEEAGWLLAGL